MAANPWIKTPKGYVVMAMVAYLLIASIGSQDLTGIKNAVVAVGIASIVDVIGSLLSKRKRLVPDGAVVTGLIISLILSTTSSWQIVAATSGIAMLSKHILAYKKKPIFNPAAFGLLLSIPIFHTEQSWWGAFGDLPSWTLLFLLLGGYPAANRVNKYPQVFSFLGSYLILVYLMARLHTGDASDALRPPFINATLFFAFFMLTDPPTSPAKAKDQVRFGILAGVLGSVVYGIFGGLMYLFIGLLAGNLYHFLKMRSSSKAAELSRRFASAKAQR